MIKDEVLSFVEKQIEYYDKALAEAERMMDKDGNDHWSGKFVAYKNALDSTRALYKFISETNFKIPAKYRRTNGH